MMSAIGCLMFVALLMGVFPQTSDAKDCYTMAGVKVPCDSAPPPPQDVWMVLRQTNVSASVPVTQRACWIVRVEGGVTYNGEALARVGSQAAAQEYLRGARGRLCK